MATKFWCELRICIIAKRVFGLQDERTVVQAVAPKAVDETFAVLLLCQFASSLGEPVCGWVLSRVK